jgi:hypothetical protein
MPDGGTLTVALGRAQAPDQNALAPGEYLRIRVSDIGVGMDPETRCAFRRCPDAVDQYCKLDVLGVEGLANVIPYRIGNARDGPVVGRSAVPRR